MLGKKIIAVIPARYKSSRFPGKPLAEIAGVPMIKRTYTQVIKSELLSAVVVATDDERIVDYCKAEDIPVVVTSDTCLTGTDRLAEVAEMEAFRDCDLFINVQGDEPVIDPAAISQIAELFLEYPEGYLAYNLYKYITDPVEINSGTIIKVIVNQHDDLMYMSRLPIPFNKTTDPTDHKQQVPVYGYTADALRVFAGRDKTINERFEDIELLRFVDLGFSIKMRPTAVASISVDVPADVEKVERFINENSRNYIK